ncbi:BQ5605_C012g06953 [Microbotryum silenes-dioicae]|uniref:BQ5605_C012g06953 protein n=1 Tax=Microbotryum silenes-dioicae TaxID=796604 RepID=A0A2X0LW46_9BASI|nr:BQ5605_C012g06953 [Microbotryum silenes-dioicae]
MRSKIGDFPGFYLRASGWAFMGPGPLQRLPASRKCILYYYIRSSFRFEFA